MAGSWAVTFKIKNFGQTPAHNVRVSYIAEAVNWVDGLPAAIPVLPDAEKLGSMGPVTDVFDMELPPLQNVATLDEVTDGNKAIYLVGKITCDTLFISF